MEHYSIIKCAFCHVLKTRSLKTSLADARVRGWPENMGGAGQVMNPSVCQFRYIEIDGTVYERDKGDIHDDMKEYFEYAKMPKPGTKEYEMFQNMKDLVKECNAQEQKMLAAQFFRKKHCHDCGVPFGNIHHVDCDMERCPKCRGQLLGCECTFYGARYFKNPADKGKRFRSSIWKMVEARTGIR